MDLPAPLPLTRKRHLTNSDPDVVARYGKGNYHTMKTKDIEYQDEKGRQYILLKEGEKDFKAERDRLVQSGVIRYPSFRGPSGLEDQYGSYGTQLFRIRKPIATRGETEWPSPGEYINTLYHLATQTVCAGTVDKIFYGPNRKTGYVTLSNFFVLDRPSNPGPIEREIDYEIRPRKRKFIR